MVGTATDKYQAVTNQTIKALRFVLLFTTWCPF